MNRTRAMSLHDSAGLPTLHLVSSPRVAQRAANTILGMVVVGAIGLPLLPWQQSINGAGFLSRTNPMDRQQTIDATIPGRILRWHVEEGSQVKAGDPLVELQDIDPQFAERLDRERLAIEQQEQQAASKIDALMLRLDNLRLQRDNAVESAEYRERMIKERLASAEENLRSAEAVKLRDELQYDRVKQLYDQKPRLASERDLEVAKANLDVGIANLKSAQANLSGAQSDVQSARADVERIRADANSNLAAADAALNDAKTQLEDARRRKLQIERDISRMDARIITAPRDGTVFRLTAAERGQIVQAGRTLMMLVPEGGETAVELWVDGNDFPLLREGRHVRLQFEGWPAVQFVGWPSVAVGTFGGIVTLIDPTDDGKGRFRVLVVQDPKDQPWPEANYLRQGVRAKGWVLLDVVPLGWEIWRQLNGFPPTVNPEDAPSNVARKRIK